MSIMSDVWIINQCVDPLPMWEEQLKRLRAELPEVASQPNLFRSKRQQIEELSLRIHNRSRTPWEPMISPFVKESVNKRSVNVGTTEEDDVRLISFGLSSYSYDLRLGRKIKLFTNTHASEIDPKNMNPKCYVEVDVEKDYFLLPPNSYFLGAAVEKLRIPRNITAICLSKSTYARAGLVINTTLIDAGFCGDLVIEGSNSTTLPMRVYVDEGICQLAFFRGDQDCLKSYADRQGKYLNQEGVQDAKV